jgi:methylated-DNA-[protein]-cysteine S-methyltransferase
MTFRAAAYDAVLAAPFGALGVCIQGEALRDIGFLPAGTLVSGPQSTAAHEVVRQLAAYLRDPRTRFDMPLVPAGTPFQRRVWAAMARIPVGETRTYGELAQALGSSARAVGQACGENPLPVVVPCHRVVSAAGLGGFAHRTDGFLLFVKRWLLAHEARAVESRGSLFAHAKA